MEKVQVVFRANNKGCCMGGGHHWQYDAKENLWQRKNDVPSTISNVRIAMVVQGKAILIGSTNQVLEYNPSTDTYTPKSNFQGKVLATGFAIEGKGYGVGEDGRCWEFDPDTNTWQEKAGMLPSIIHMTGFSLGGYGYVLGDLNKTSYNENQPLKVWRYDPNKNQWSRFSKDYKGDGAYEIKAVSMDDRVYVGLGYNNGDFNATDLWLFE